MKHLLIIVLVLQSPLAVADRAEDLKQDGMAAARRNDWELARKRFEASYALEPRPLTLYNLAAAEERTDKLLAARATFAKFLATTKVGEHDKFRTLAGTAIEKLAKQIPTIRIRVVGFPAGMTVKLDGKPVSLDTPIEVDPGAHEAVGTRDAVTVRRSITIDRGERQELELTAPPPEVVEPTPPPVVVEKAPVVPVETEPGKRSVFASGWFWTAAAAVVLGAAGGGYYFFVYDRTADPTRGTLGRGVIEIP